MTAKNKEQYEKSSEWKNWLVFINNTHTKLDDIENIASQAYFNKQYLNVYFAKLKMFITVRKSFIEDYDIIKKKLDQIGKSVFSVSYLNDYSNANKSASVNKFQFKATEILNNILEVVSENFSDSELIPKIKKKWKRTQSRNMRGVSV